MKKEELQKILRRRAKKGLKNIGETNPMWESVVDSLSLKDLVLAFTTCHQCKEREFDIRDMDVCIEEASDDEDFFAVIESLKTDNPRIKNSFTEASTLVNAKHTHGEA